MWQLANQFGTVVSTPPSAIAAYRMERDAGRINGGAAPPGSYMYWDIGADGHVAYVMNDGRMLMATSHLAEQWVASYAGWNTAAGYEAATGARPLGWSWRNGGNSVPFTGASGAGGGEVPVANFSTDTQQKLQQYVANGGLYSGPVDGELGVESWKAIQTWLQMYGLYGGPIDGEPGINTFKGLQQVAQKGGYAGPIDGMPGPNTEAGLNKWLTEQLNPSVPVPTTDWAAWQKFLQGYGYTGPVDGEPGPNTYAALQRFLAAEFDYEGVIDGIPGDLTWAAFDRAVAAGYPKDDVPPPPPPPPTPGAWPDGEKLLAGVDLGSSQSGFVFPPFEAAGGDFSFLKMGGGNASDSPYRAPHYLAQLERARKTGLVVGHYWFNGNKNGLTPTTAAQFYAKNAMVIKGDVFILDVEAEPGNAVPAYTPAEVLEFTREVRKTFPGARFLIYLNRNLLKSYDWSPVQAEGHELWVATLDGTRNPEIRWWAKATVIQFGQSTNVAGNAGVIIDQNIATDLSGVRYNAAPPPPPPPAPDPEGFPSFVTKFHMTSDSSPRPTPLEELPVVKLVLHHAGETDIADVLPLFDPGPPREVSCTICIDKDGTAYGIVSPKDRPFTSGNPVDAIAITVEVVNSEVVGDPAKAESWLISDESYASIVKVAKWMDEIYPGFEIDQEHIDTHRDYNPSTLCPGSLSVDKVIALATPPVPGPDPDGLIDQIEELIVNYRKEIS
jgi:peptidoglycan hydrolase-like protein with peptidoglycan-binding domain